jgi:hypothetical protein
MEKIRIRDSGWKKVGSGIRINIPYPQHGFWSTLPLTFAKSNMTLKNMDRKITGIFVWNFLGAFFKNHFKEFYNAHQIVRFFYSHIAHIIFFGRGGVIYSKHF